MHVEISEDTYQAIAAINGNVAAFVEQAARQALGKAGSSREPESNDKFNVEQILSEFRELEGMFGAASFDEVLDDRRCGIE